MPAVWPKRVTLHSPRLRRRRAADLALLAKAARYVQALVGTLAELREGAELPTTGRYVGLVHDGVVDLGDWLGDAVGDLEATPTPPGGAGAPAGGAGARRRPRARRAAR